MQTPAYLEKLHIKVIIFHRLKAIKWKITELKTKLVLPLAFLVIDIWL